MIHEQNTPAAAAVDDPTIANFPAVLTNSQNVEYPRVDLVQGRGEGLSGVTNSVLYGRLRTAALVLAGGFSVFLVWKLIAMARGQNVNVGAMVSLVAVIIIVGSCGFTLCRSCVPTSRRLRIKELIIFGLPAVFLMHVQYLNMTEIAVM